MESLLQGSGKNVPLRVGCSFESKKKKGGVDLDNA